MSLESFLAINSTNQLFYKGYGRKIDKNHQYISDRWFFIILIRKTYSLEEQINQNTEIISLIDQKWLVSAYGLR